VVIVKRLLQLEKEIAEKLLDGYRYEDAVASVDISQLNVIERSMFEEDYDDGEITKHRIERNIANKRSEDESKWKELKDNSSSFSLVRKFKRNNLLFGFTGVPKLSTKKKVSGFVQLIIFVLSILLLVSSGVPLLLLSIIWWVVDVVMLRFSDKYTRKFFIGGNG